MACTPEKAFDVFTKEMATWWPPDHHILDGELEQIVFEPRVGGDIYDRATNGNESHWGKVLAFEPPHRLVFGWRISLQWQIEEDEGRVSEVEVRFVPEATEHTRVELEHRHIDRHGEGWEQIREAVASPGGWDRGLARLAEAISAPSA